MINFNTDIDKILKLPMKIMVALCIGSSLILFLPNKIIEKMYMLNFRNEFGFVIGLIFIVTLSIVVCNFVVFAIKKIYYAIKMFNKNKVNIKKITTDEIEILKNFYNKDLQQFTKASVHIPSNNKTRLAINNLIYRNIFEKKSDAENMMSYNGYGSAFNLTVSAIKKLNKKNIKKTILR